jgi:ATP-dependent RNA helicase HelY
LTTSQRRGGDIRIRGLTVERRLVSLNPDDFPAPPRLLGHIDLPVPFTPNNNAFRRAAAITLTKAKLQGSTSPDGHDSSRLANTSDRGARHGRPGQDLPEEHPVAACPDAAKHVRSAERAARLEADLERLERRIRGRVESLARQFDRVLRILEAWGYVDGWTVTDGGRRLTRVFHESDLLIAECVGAGLFDDLDPAAVAGLVSVFTYEQRGPGPAPAPWFPSGNVRQRWQDIERLTRELNLAEEDAGLPLTRPPDPGFLGLAHAWAAGEDLEQVMADEEMSGGDFVRNIKQLIDLLRQVAQVAQQPATAAAARSAADDLFRGVVAASSVIGAPEHGAGQEEDLPVA